MPKFEEVVASLVADGFRDADPDTVQMENGNGYVCCYCRRTWRGSAPVLGFRVLDGRCKIVCADRRACRTRLHDAERAKAAAEVKRIEDVEKGVTL